MFGKGRRSKSSTEKFIIAKGIDAGNLKGRGKSDKTAPFAKKSSLAVKPVPERPMSKGKAGPVKLIGD